MRDSELNFSKFLSHTLKRDSRLHRIHDAVYEPLYFSSTGDGRFDLVDVPGQGTCYAGTSPTAAFVEKFGRLRYLTQQLVDSNAIAEITLLTDLRLANLTDRRVLGLYGLSGDISTGPPAEYEKPQALARQLFVAGFQGVLYRARHDPALTEESVAIFGNETNAGEWCSWISQPIPGLLVREMEGEFGFSAFPSAPLQ